METIYIPQLLKAPEKSESIQVQDFIAGLDTLTPVRGRMVVTHGGTYLEVCVQAETILTLTCDRCLRQYNHRLSLNNTELIWLGKNADPANALSLEREISQEDLSETLPPEGTFEPETWLYEQLYLAMPLRQLCSQDCQPPALTSSESEPLIDSRWASLEALKKQLKVEG